MGGDDLVPHFDLVPLKSTAAADMEDANAPLTRSVQEDSCVVEIVQKREMNAWLLYDWANGPYFYLAVTFLPLVITSQAKEVAKTVYCGGPCNGTEWAVDFEKDGQCDNSFYKTNSSCVENGHDWEADLKDDAKYVDFLGSQIGFASFPQYCTVVSVILQLIVYMTMGSFADYGKNRKRMLIGSTWLGIVSVWCLWFTGDQDLYWVNGLLLITSVVGFNFAVVFYNAYLSVLIEATPSVVEAKEKGYAVDKINDVARELTHVTSVRGLAVGFFGQLVFLICNIPILNFVTDEDELSLRASIMVAGAWVAVFSGISFAYLKTRPGPPLPAGDGYCHHSFHSVKRTLKTFSTLTELRKFLIAYFIFSDGTSTLGGAALIFGQEELNMNPQQVLLVLIEVSVCGIIGCYFFKYLHEKRKWHSKTILIVNLACMGLIPIYAIASLTHIWEFYMTAAVFGFNTASQQAFTRSIYAHHIPSGRESEYFSFYEISDKGTAWLGPLILGLVFQATGSYRSAFGTLVAFFVIGTLLLFPFNPVKAERQRDEFEKQDQVRHGSHISHSHQV